MSTGIILGLGLLLIVVIFYITLNFPGWIIEYKIRRGKKMSKVRKYHDWVYEADDTMNKSLKFVIYCTYAYGFYLIVKDLIK